MKIVGHADTLAWLHNRGVTTGTTGIALTGFFEVKSYHIPSDCGGKAVLARAISDLFREEREAILWINEFGIWPSCENWNLFDGFRRSLGEKLPLQERPGHVFSKEDSASINSLSAMVLYFVWGAVLVPASANYLIKISHDEIITIYARDNSGVCTRLRDFITFLKELCDEPEGGKPGG